jgi:hypothetical protein
MPLPSDAKCVRCKATVELARDGGVVDPVLLGGVDKPGERLAHELVLVAFVAAVGLVVVAVIQARAVKTVSHNVRTRDELQLAVDRRSHLLGKALEGAGLGPDDSISHKLKDGKTSAALASLVKAVATLPVSEEGLSGGHKDLGHMVLVDATTGLCVANSPARRLTPEAAAASPVDLNHLTAEGGRQRVSEHNNDPATSNLPEPIMPVLNRKVAAGGGHVSFTAAGQHGVRRWHCYFAAVPGVKAYLGASAPLV